MLWLAGERPLRLIYCGSLSRSGVTLVRIPDDRRIFNAVDASLARLESPYLDLFQIHRYDRKVPAEETMKSPPRPINGSIQVSQVDLGKRPLMHAAKRMRMAERGICPMVESRTEDGGEDEAVPTIVDYARGAALMESSDDGEEDGDLPPRVSLTDGSGSDNDQDGFISLGAKSKKRHEDEEVEIEIDLDENTIAALDAQVAEYAKTIPDREEAADVQQTRRLAVVNLDWDYVRAAHLFKIFSSHVSPIASETAGKNRVTRGRLLSVRVYPSEFGKKRMTRSAH
ncbi:hypothetical protein EV363DRAFT_1224978 [Boletus edulis]|nr:hypothetical protein EV363DRAFT_1224978 [Boletus edulis]